MREAHSGFRDRPAAREALPRRAFLLHALTGLGAGLLPGWLSGCSQRPRGAAGAARPASGSGVKAQAPGSDGFLRPPDANGLRLGDGFSARIVARGGEAPCASSKYVWHGAPDGGATFATRDGGLIYVSNSETLRGGAGALRFDAQGKLIDAYRILDGTRGNCAGGRTPWGTWLSCEEIGNGKVYECDPTGKEPALVRPALGSFKHEAVAVDTVNHHLYLTEDEPDGLLYRFVPDALTRSGYANLSKGRLEAAIVQPDGKVTWEVVPDPSAARAPTRRQVRAASTFRGGEGIWYHTGVVYFSTKGDDRVWSYHVETAKLRVLYDPRTNPNPLLSGVDNVTVAASGEVLVAEDGGHMQIIGLSESSIRPIVQVTGQPGSEITGPAFSPDGKRLYFSSQRSRAGRPFSSGITYEVTGPFTA
jgi:uncharacterized protein